MKLHKHLIEKIIQALLQIFNSTSFADKVIEKFMKANKKWGARDRKLFAETVYEIVRYRRRYWNLAGLDDDNYLIQEKNSEFEMWKMWLAYIAEKEWEVPDWMYSDYEYIMDDVSDEPKNLKKLSFTVSESYPDWLYQYFKTQFQDSAETVMKSLNEMAQIYLRVNTLKTTPVDLMQELQKEGVNSKRVRKVETALELVDRKNVFITKAFKDGLFEVQDVSSQMIGELLSVSPGMRVVDACAGAGGKSLHLAAIMKNKGKIISLDLHEWKLKELRKRASRNSVDIIEVKVIESLKTIKRLEKSFDRVLLDVPCSGSGVIRRNPDKKWKLTSEEIDHLIQVQKDILDQYKSMMKDGGKLVYSTCSLFPEENELQIQRFLKENPNWKLEKEIKIFPHVQGFDGFYGARLTLLPQS
ncbi:MAG: methyltransferase domain-containing protein [Bdellovibrionales bacterium]|nr:methyltransferase domain-containing protein [Bdellovibrionales bacterium]